jgi:predicted aspartyl protease
MPVTSRVNFRIVEDSIVIAALVNGQTVECVLDTGDAIGPVFTAADAARLKLVKGAPFGVEGAGGASTSYESVATVQFDSRIFKNEPVAIDESLADQSLLGLPFFLGKCQSLSFDFQTGILTMVGF